MIAGNRYRPVFMYQFRPLMNDRRAPDGGFCILLYENSILSFSTYDVSGAFLDEICFVLPPQVIHFFHGLVQSARNWLPACPCDLRAANVTPYASSFAFDGYDPVRIWGINALLNEPTGTESGFYTRHLYVLFEDVCNLLRDCGIRLSLDGFTWDTQRVHSFRKKQSYYTGRQGVV